MTFSRRRFLSQAAPGVLGLLPGCAARDQTTFDEDQLVSATPEDVRAELQPEPREAWPAPGEASPFQHGVASGDPLNDAVILWTRVTPPSAATAAIEIEWRLALDPELEQVIGEGSVRTDASRDYTAHVDASGLASGTTYYYQFRALGQTSLRGRTRTLPTGAVQRLRLGVVSCSNYPGGFFNVYGLLASADVDLVLHLGDYIYEYADGTLGVGAAIGRAPEPPREVLTLADYRLRHAHYKRDLDLQAVHRQHPFVAVWDDHDVANNAYLGGAENHQSNEGDYALRREAALQAYREWLPLRPRVTEAAVYRSFACGELLDLVMLDTRHQARAAQGNPCNEQQLGDPARELLGGEQEAWLGEQLTSSQARGARWRLIGQQVIFAPLWRSDAGCVVTADNWDGYSASRERVFNLLDRAGIDNVIVLTGDAHASWGNDVPRDPFAPGAYDPESGRGSRLVELVTPPLSSPPRGNSEREIRLLNPHVKFSEQQSHGYLLLDVTPERAQAEWHLVPTVRQPGAEVTVAASLQTLSGQPWLQSAAAPSVARDRLPAPAR
ncbi:MAG: Phospholipase precursor [Pseudomonadota bacterium]